MGYLTGFAGITTILDCGSQSSSLVWKPREWCIIFSETAQIVNCRRGRFRGGKWVLNPPPSDLKLCSIIQKLVDWYLVYNSNSVYIKRGIIPQIQTIKLLCRNCVCVCEIWGGSGTHTYTHTPTHTHTHTLSTVQKSASWVSFSPWQNVVQTRPMYKFWARESSWYTWMKLFLIPAGLDTQ